MLRVSPAWPVAQNGQFIPQPAWLETQTVTRSGYRISTVSTSAPSNSRHSVFTVAPWSASRTDSGVSSSGSSVPTRSARPSAGRSVIWPGSTV